MMKILIFSYTWLSVIFEIYIVLSCLTPDFPRLRDWMFVVVSSADTTIFIISYNNHSNLQSELNKLENKNRSGILVLITVLSI